MRVSVVNNVVMQLSHTGTTLADTATLFYCPLMMHLPPLLRILFTLPFFPFVSLPACLLCAREETVAPDNILPVCPTCVCVCKCEESLILLLSSLTASFSVAATAHLCLRLSASACCYVRHALWTPAQPLGVVLWGNQIVCHVWCEHSLYSQATAKCINECFLRC